MMYVMYPTENGRVIDGVAVAAGYGDTSQEDARERALSVNPRATGTARAWIGNTVLTGAVAGQDLDVEHPRG